MTGRARRKVLRVLRNAMLYGATALIVIFAVFPFYWMALTALKQNRDLYTGAADPRHVPWIFNVPPTFAHVQLLFQQTNYLIWVRNTVLVGAAVVVITLVLAVPAGYALARLTGRWGEPLGIGLFLTYLVPPTLLFLPFSRIVAVLHLENTLWSLVLVYPTFTVPFCTWLLMGFFRAIPKDLEEQAMTDGYSRLAAVRKIVLPLAVSGFLTVAIFSFTLVLQEFLYALTFISSVGTMTVSLGIPVALVRGDVYYWGSLMAAALITSIPVAIAYNLFVDRFIAGLTAGAVKG